ncbi:MYCBP-associated protein [Gadus chalcogrammus]|uniref:MYCBP-associated protein n=1 Tax=Gadus chalcogrammus TaxID=1042646 RepID=UPI0024C3AC7A|nr:MYCBP-associated protein [Gadus chalcogrammus]
MAHVVATESGEITHQRDFRTRTAPGCVNRSKLMQVKSIQPNLHSPKPPTDSRKQEEMTGALTRRIRTGQQGCKTVEEAEGQLCQAEGTMLLRHTGHRGPRYDHQGVVLPHSILGNLQDFKSYLETRGETESVRRLRETTTEALSGPSSSAPGGGHAYRGAEDRGGGLSAGQAHTQSHALQHWSTHMRQRRRQQESLAKSLHRPKDWLLMNRANSFRRVQEQRELLSLVLPAIQPGHGYRVGSEFWSQPECLGDEVGGIVATLTRSQRGQRESLVRVGQPRSVQHESGNVVSEKYGPAPKGWNQSEYLQRQQQQIQPLLKERDLEAPDMEHLEVLGSGRPVTRVSVPPKPLHREEEAREKATTEKRDPGVQDDGDDGDDGDGDDDDTAVMPVPALMFCGQRAHWTGSSSSHQGQRGISSRMGFEVVIGATARSHLLLRNQGNSALCYTWQRLELPRCFTGTPRTARQTASPHFYFNSSMGVILPCETQQVDFIFKSDTPGIKCELWQVNTHPVLLGGAAMQLTLRGVALDRDTNADHRLGLERELERKAMVKVCQSLVSEVLRGVTTPERASSPAELYITEDQEFLWKNPKFHYAPGPVEALRGLWQSAAPGRDWDLSVGTLRQAVLSLPEDDPGPGDTAHTLTRDQGLARLNATLLELPPHPLTSAPVTPAAVGRQLWRELLDGLAGEAATLQHMLGLPETDTWSQPDLDPDLGLEEEVKTVGKGERKGGTKEVNRAGGAKEKEDGRGASKAPAKERATLKERGGEEVTKAPGGRRATESSLAVVGQEATSPTLCDDTQHNVQPEDVLKYRTHLNQKVYVLMDHLVDSLASLLDALGDEER